MESQEFIVLYTHQKTKKSKVWQDGILKIAHLGNKAILYDDKGECLESLFLTRLKVKPGDDLESERYLITVEEARAAGSTAVSQEDIQEARGPRPLRPMPCGWSLGCQPAGLKRKFTGFQGPRQEPKKMVTMDNGESAVSLEAAAPGPALPSLFSSAPLFSAAGRKEVNSVPADLRSLVVCKDSGRSGLPVSPVGSAPSKGLREEGHLCSPVSSAVKATVSLLPDEPTKGHRLAPRCLGVTQNIRSKAQILALLKSKPASLSEEVDAEMSGLVPKVQPQESLQVPANPECFTEQGAGAAGRTESLQCQPPPESTGSSDSRWAECLSSRPSPARSAVAGDELERQAQAQGGDVSLNLRDFLGQKRIQLFEIGAENVEQFNGGKLIDDADSSWDQEVKLEIPSFSESLSVTCGNLGKDSLVSESDMQGNIPMPVNQNDQVCVKRFFLTRENVQEIDTCGTPAREYKQALSHLPESERLQPESSLSDSSEISEAISDTSSRANTDSKSLSIHAPGSHVTQPVLEVNFNLNNFETSDTEEESQQSNKMSQDPEDWEREALADACGSGVQRRCEGVRCEEHDGASWPLLMPTAGKPTEPFPTPATLPAQPCGAAGPTRDEVAGCGDSTVGWTGDVCSAGKPLVPILPAVLQFPRLNQESQLCSASMMMRESDVDQSGPLQSLQSFSLESGEETIFPAVTPTQMERTTWDPQPVEFQGHQVQGSATSAVMVRGHCLPLECSQLPGHPEHNSSTADTCAWATKLPRTRVQVDYLQVPPPAQEGSAPSPASALSLRSQDEAFLLEVPEGALQARPSPGMGRFSSLEDQHLPRLPLVSGALAALATVPPAAGPPDRDPGACAARGWQPPPGSPPFSLCEEPAVLPPSSGPEDQSETLLCQVSMEAPPGGVSLLHRMSAHSRWLKYQSTPPCALPTPSPAEASGTDGCPATAMGMCLGDAGERRSDAGAGSSGPTPLQRVRGELRQRQQQGAGARDLVCRRKALSVRLQSASKAEDVRDVWEESACATGSQEINVSELCFPSGREMWSALLPRRRTRVPASFRSPAHYKQVFTACLVEHLNILLCGLAQRLHKALSAVDISFYTSSHGEGGSTVGNSVPSCRHQRPAKLVMVKKEGPNKGRLFYTCDAPRADRCNFFKWFEEATPGHITQEDSAPALVLSDVKSIGLYLRSQSIALYEECQLSVRKGFDFQRKQCGKLKKFMTVNPDLYNEPKSKLYLKLSRKESSSTYSKDDLWVVSKTLDFQLDTFIACSAFFGPSSANEVELLPLKGYFPSRWPTDTVVHALWVCNASTELTTLRNMREHFNPSTLPLTQHLLAMPSSTTVSSKRVDKRTFVPPAFSNTKTNCELPSPGAALQLAREFIQAHQLNEDQASALTQIAGMVASRGPAEEGKGLPASTLPITIIHGVFGAGKSYLLAVVILFLVQLFEKSDAPTVGSAQPWKVLISSSTNVAVDRVLLGLLSLGFEKFVRVGCVRKIAKPVLPYSLHAGSENASEQLKELHALMKEDLTPMERVYVRRSIEQHKLGTNRTLLGQVRVVGATCAACLFPCMAGLRFPVVVLDESSQMTEPASLLPIARFECEKLVLVGDPKQLPPTIQGSDAAHENGLEQTLFDRLCLMGHKPVLLRTQYRCHPAIAAVANDLFYGGGLRNGVSPAERGPLLAWLPTLCFYNVPGQEQMEGGNSFHNEAEAAFTLMLIRALVAGGVPGTMIGVITLYKSQLGKLCQLLGAVDLDRPHLATVQVSTVDAFQGAEKEVVVLSCVRTRQVGFIDSEQRVNVALTRGRRHLLIVGHLACLRRNRLWGRAIQHCQGREDGLQQASQCEPQLMRLLEEHAAEKLAEEKQRKASGRDRHQDASRSQTNGPGIGPLC
uniref:5'-3' DNA helicase ZGRF1 n=1 Tax=Pipistrellus kuhlii TaxID=59472 RepID=A0A7J7UB58_PIPKU|nr:zinc finger GRF-type containing 1 [Pipistrellus kuhlii]